MGRGRKDPPGAFRGSITQPVPWFQTFGLQNCEHGFLLFYATTSVLISVGSHRTRSCIQNTTFYCTLQLLSFSQIESLWQPCIEQGCPHHFSNSMYSLCVSVSHVGTSCNISNPPPAKKIMTFPRLRWWSALFSNKIFFKLRYVLFFLRIMLLHT